MMGVHHHHDAGMIKCDADNPGLQLIFVKINIKPDVMAIVYQAKFYNYI